MRIYMHEPCSTLAQRPPAQTSSWLEDQICPDTAYYSNAAAHYQAAVLVGRHPAGRYYDVHSKNTIMVAHPAAKCYKSCRLWSLQHIQSASIYKQ
jgi:hypothetical protein